MILPSCPTAHSSAFRHPFDEYTKSLWRLAAFARTSNPAYIVKMLRRPKKRRAFGLSNSEVLA